MTESSETRSLIRLYSRVLRLFSGRIVSTLISIAISRFAANSFDDLSRQKYKKACGQIKDRCADGSPEQFGTFGSALGTNLINNVPMAVVMNSSMGSIQHAAPAIRNGFVAATMFGCDLGPNLTTVGSLATILWLLILRQRDVDVSGLDYFKVGVVVTPLMLLAGAFTIWLCL